MDDKNNREWTLSLFGKIDIQFLGGGLMGIRQIQPFTFDVAGIHHGRWKWHLEIWFRHSIPFNSLFNKAIY
jgi:hypothetical protein